MMNICNSCLENKWKFKHVDGWILATCEICGNEVQFETRKNKNRRRKLLEPEKEAKIWHFMKDGETWMHNNGEEYPVMLKVTPKYIKIVRKNGKSKRNIQSDRLGI